MGDEEAKLTELEERLRGIGADIEELQSDIADLTSQAATGQSSMRWWLKLGMILAAIAFFLGMISLLAALLAYLILLGSGPGAPSAVLPGSIAFVTKFLALLALLAALIALFIAWLKARRKASLASTIQTLVDLQREAEATRTELERLKKDLESKPH